MKLKKVVGFLVFLIILVAAYKFSYHVLSWKDTDGTKTTVFQGLYETDDNLVDVLFLGSSHCYCTVNNAQLWEDYGYSTFNMAISGQDMASTYYSFQEVLKSQKPKVVMVEMCYAAWYGYGVEGNLFRNLLNYRFSKNYVEAVKNLVTEEKQLEVLLRLPLIHSRYQELEEYDFNFKTINHRGYVPVFHTQTVFNPNYTPEGAAEPIRDVTQGWMDKIVALAEENQIEVVFFLAPYSADEADKAYFRSVEEYSKKNSIPFLNFLSLWNEIGLDEEVDFADYSHVNYIGAQKVTEYIGDFLSSKYSLADHRGQKEYVLWDKFSTETTRKIEAFELSKQTEFEAYLKQLSKLEKNQLVVFSMDGDFTLSKDVEKKILEFLGIDDDSLKNGTWILENQELVYSTNGKKEYFYHHSTGNLDLILKGYYEEVSLEGYYKDVLSEEDRSEILNHQDCIIDGTKIVKVSNGINIVVYDTVLDEMIDRVGFLTDSDLQVYRYDYE